MDYLKWVCIATAALQPVPALIGTVRAWWRRELGQGARRPEPTIAALLGNAAWFMFGYSESQGETLGLNAWGGFVQMLGLLTFVFLCTHGERARAYTPFTFAVLYLCVTADYGIKNSNLQAYQWLCAFSGMVAGAAPLFTFFLTENRTLELFPGWPILLCYALHGLVWMARGWMMKLRDNYMISQNGVGAVCSVLQLLVVLWLSAPNPRKEQNAVLRRWLLSGLERSSPTMIQAPAPQEIGATTSGKERASSKTQPPDLQEIVTTNTGNQGASQETHSKGASPEAELPDLQEIVTTNTGNVGASRETQHPSLARTSPAASTPSVSRISLQHRVPQAPVLPINNGENVPAATNPAGGSRRSLRLQAMPTPTTQSITLQTEGSSQKRKAPMSGSGSRPGRKKKKKLNIPSGGSRGIKRKEPAAAPSTSTGEGGSGPQKKRK